MQDKHSRSSKPALKGSKAVSRTLAKTQDGMVQFLSWLVLSLGLISVAQGQFTFTTNADNTLTITGYTGPGGDVTIPDSTNGLPVTSIGDFAFSACTGLDSITIGSSVTNIGKFAFSGCTLTNVTIPDSVIMLGTGAFQSCASLNSVTIGKGILVLYSQVFAGCYGLANVNIPDSVVSIQDQAFDECTNLGII